MKFISLVLILSIVLFLILPWRGLYARGPIIDCLGEMEIGRACHESRYQFHLFYGGKYFLAVYTRSLADNVGNLRVIGIYDVSSEPNIHLSLAALYITSFILSLGLVYTLRKITKKI